jgi:threonine synthase
MAGGSLAVATGQFTCSRCDWAAPAEVTVWRCPRCASAIEFASGGNTELAVQALEGEGVWRYKDWLGVRQMVSLGEPRTSLAAFPGQPGVMVKNEAALPTGAFKDRGAAVFVAWLAERGVAHIALDSSGNAGAALAAYAARAGIACDVYVPRSTSPAKRVQAQIYGARVVPIDGARAASGVAAQRAAAEQGVVYASHIWHPAFVLGVQTLAFELWEQCPTLPAAIVMPVGAGTLLLGLARGFQRLQNAGLIQQVPRLIGVQASSCAPIAEQFGFASAGATAKSSIAEGIQVADPPRAQQIVAAIQESDGCALAVDDDAIGEHATELGSAGLLVEPTAAAAFAGLQQARDRDLLAAEESVVVILTGSGLKTLSESMLAEPNLGPD